MSVRRQVLLLAAGLALASPAALPQQRDEKELQLVRRIRERILANSKEKDPAEMKRYRLQIPGTHVSFSMVPIPGGEFLMGTPETEASRQEDEGPQRRVRLDPFWMGEFEVTWDEYRLFMLKNASGRKDGDELVDAIATPTPPYSEMSFGMGINGFPAISMTQHAASKYAEWLSAKTGHFYRLPTEAEWEYACRAGTTTAYSFGDDPAQLGEYGWYWDNSDGRYHQVGKKKPNPWGLYDMHGNVWEWTLDQYAPYEPAPAGEILVNPWKKATKLYPRVVRGGSWFDEAPMARCGARRGSESSWKSQDPQLPQSIWYHTDAIWLGFRLVRPLKIPDAEQMYDYWNSAAGLE